MSDIARIILNTDHSVPIAPSSGVVTVKNIAGGTVYYKSRPEVSSSSNDGSLTTGQSVTLTTQAWFKASAATTITVTSEAQHNVSAGGLAAANTLGTVVYKLAIRDAAGNTVGYVPVYDAITFV